MVRRTSHRKALEKIAQSPSKFGFDHIVSVSVEPTLYLNAGSERVVAEPDIVMESSKGEIHVVEYKSNGNGRLVERAHKQLENAKWWFGRYRPNIPPGNIKTHLISGTDPRYRDLLK